MNSEAYIELGPCPYDEDAAQLGVDPNFTRNNINECSRYKALLESLFLPKLPHPDTEIKFQVKLFPYDGVGYREVIIIYNENQNFAREFAYYVEANTPATWDWTGDDIDDFKMPG